MNGLFWTSRRHWWERVNNTVIEFHLSVTSGSSQERTRAARLVDRDANDYANSPPRYDWCPPHKEAYWVWGVILGRPETWACAPAYSQDWGEQKQYVICTKIGKYCGSCASVSWQYVSYSKHCQLILKTDWFRNKNSFELTFSLFLWFSGPAHASSENFWHFLCGAKIRAECDGAFTFIIVETFWQMT